MPLSTDLRTALASDTPIALERLAGLNLEERAEAFFLASGRNIRAINSILALSTKSEILQIIGRRDSEVSSGGAAGESPEDRARNLMWALRLDSLEPARLIVSSATPPERAEMIRATRGGEPTYDPLIDAAQNGRLDIVELFCGAVPKETAAEFMRAPKFDGQPYGALRAAIRFGHPNVVRFFLLQLTAEEVVDIVRNKEGGVPIEGVDPSVFDTYNPLREALGIGSLEVFALLLRRIPLTDKVMEIIKSEAFLKVFHNAALKGDAQSEESVLDCLPPEIGFEILNSVNRDFSTFSHLIERGNLDVAAVFLDGITDYTTRRAVINDFIARLTSTTHGAAGAGAAGGAGEIDPQSLLAAKFLSVISDVEAPESAKVVKGLRRLRSVLMEKITKPHEEQNPSANRITNHVVIQLLQFENGKTTASDPGPFVGPLRDFFTEFFHRENPAATELDQKRVSEILGFEKIHASEQQRQAVFEVMYEFYLGKPMPTPSRATAAGLAEGQNKCSVM